MGRRAGGGAAGARAPAAWPGHGRPQRPVRQAGAPPGVLAGGLEWPEPPVICTAALARAMLPLQRVRRLGALADALGIDVERAHRALADAETCARVLCALFPRLCAHAATVAEALALLAPRRPRRPKAAARAGGGRGPGCRSSILRELPRDPGVYLFRDEAGATLYVGKSISIRTRARAHFAPSSRAAGWTPHAAIVDYRTTRSELGALVLENRLIKELDPPGNIRLTRRDDRLVYIRCRLDIPSRSSRWPRSRRPGTRSRSGRCTGDGWRASSSSSSTPCSDCATAAAACRVASTPRRTARWDGACRRASAIWTRTSTAAGSIGAGVVLSDGGRAPSACSSTSRPRCATPPPSNVTSAPRGCDGGRAGWA